MIVFFMNNTFWLPVTRKNINSSQGTLFKFYIKEVIIKIFRTKIQYLVILFDLVNPVVG
ncbi:hypothetical protein ES708_04694 [subsurface metagenome]